jgi:hypothetical protein
VSVFKVEVNTAGDPPGSFAGNRVEHDTQEAAVAAARDLFMRWTAVRYWRVMELDEDQEPPYCAVVATNEVFS